MIVYIKFEVSFHGLKYRKYEQLERLKKNIEQNLKYFHPNYNYDSDLEVEIIEHAGEEDK